MNSLAVLLTGIFLLLNQILILCLVTQLRQMAISVRDCLLQAEAKRHSRTNANPEPITTRFSTSSDEQTERPTQRRRNQACQIFPAVNAAPTLSFDTNVFDTDNYR
jgi:hypothetical protein